VGYQCCFCGREIQDSEWEPIALEVSFPDVETAGGAQLLWSHIDCLGSRLHDSVPWLTLEDHRALSAQATGR